MLLGLGTIQRNGGFRGDALRTYGGPTSEKIRLRAGDLYVSLKDVTHAADLLGAVARVPEDIDDARMTQDTVRIDIVGEGLDSAYLYWLLRTSTYRTYCRNRGTGTTNLDLSREDFFAFEFECPSLPEQQAIAEVLGALDDKIAVNEQACGSADELARAMYGSLRSSTEIELGDLVSNVRDQVSPDRVLPTLPYVGLEHVPRRRMWLDAMGAASEVSSAKSRFEPGDVLFGKLRPYFHKVVAAPSAGIASTDVLVLRPIKAELGGYALAALSSDRVVLDATASSEGTRMPRASWKDLSRVHVPWPGSEAAASFSSQIGAISGVVESLFAENRSLAVLRDTLLPQLMSGKLRVRDAEKVVSDAV